jgi:hypothetical protein
MFRHLKWPQKCGPIVFITVLGLFFRDASGIPSKSNSVILNFAKSHSVDAYAATNGFGAILLLTVDDTVFKRWDQVKGPVEVKTAEAVERGVPLFTVLVFAGPATNLNGRSEVSFDLILRKPDGSIYAVHTNLIGIAGPGTGGPSSDQMLVAEEFIGIRIEESDLEGLYYIEAIVRDHIGMNELRLSTRFRAVDAKVKGNLYAPTNALAVPWK